MGSEIRAQSGALSISIQAARDPLAADWLHRRQALITPLDKERRRRLGIAEKACLRLANELRELCQVECEPSARYYTRNQLTRTE